MNKLLLFLATILTANCYSQILFEKGYYIDNSSQKTECFIKNEDWEGSAINVKYKLSENDEPKTISIQSIKELGIYNVSKYIIRTLRIDKSSEDVNELSDNKDPIFSEEKLFLKTLVEGKANLYMEGNSKKFFYNVGDTAIEQLIFKSYKGPENSIETNNQYKLQLWDNLKCSTITSNTLLKLNYKKNSLITVFSEYNKCSNSQFINYSEKESKAEFNLTLRPRLNYSSFKTNEPYPIDYGDNLSFGFGIEMESILPFNKNKWALLLEATYQNFNGEVNRKLGDASHIPVHSEVKYTSIEIPVGVRHYFFINSNSKIFVNASFVFDLPINAKIQFGGESGETLENSTNLAFGIGYKLNDRYGIEMRYNASRNNLNDFGVWSSDYQQMSVIFGYSLFKKKPTTVK